MDAHRDGRVTIGGTMVWLPTCGNDTPDFLIPKADTSKVKARNSFPINEPA